MDNLYKARIFAVVMSSMIGMMLAFIFGLRALYVLVPKDLGIPFQATLLRAPYCGGFGGMRLGT